MSNRYIDEARRYYPSCGEVDAWAMAIRFACEQTTVYGERILTNRITTSFGNGPNALASCYIRFTAGDGRLPFYGYWQPAFAQPAPLLINLPGYGGSINLHPQINDLGYNILHISPLGYINPDGEAAHMKDENGLWPVLCNTAYGREGGYSDWLSDCLLAIRWANEQAEVYKNRMSFYGTSQGGGTALLLASILGDQVRCVCADLPFLTNFPAAELRGDAYSMLLPVYKRLDHAVFWHNLGLIDTLSHAHRLHIPTMLTAGGMDTVCPPLTVKSLFKKLSCTKQYTLLNNGVHTHSRESMYLFSAWLKLFA